MDAIALLGELTAVPGPPGQEDAVRDLIAAKLDDLGIAHSTDAKGNLLAKFGARPRVLVTAHLDEIAMLATAVHPDGSLSVAPMGGLNAWKHGEGPVTLLGKEAVPGVLGFGSMHTEDPSSRAVQAKEDFPGWRTVRIHTGLSADRLAELGVGVGTRVVSADRALWPVGDLIAGRFLDDRADLVSWILALEVLRKDPPEDVWFAATVAEEVGGEGAQYLMQTTQPDVCIALELGPNVPDAPVDVSDVPTLWVTDSYASMKPSDIALVESLGQVQRQALSRGGSDASCAAGSGLCARPITLGLAMENSHGFEIIHPGSMKALAELTVGLVRALS